MHENIGSKAAIGSIENIPALSNTAICIVDMLIMQINKNERKKKKDGLVKKGHIFLSGHGCLKLWKF